MKQKLAAARLPVKDIRELRKLALQINGPAAAYVRHSDRVVAKVMGRDGKLQENEIDETHFEAYLDTKDIPDPDLVDPHQRGTALIELSLMAAGLQ